MPPCSRRQTRPWVPLRPEGGAVIVSVHSTALPPWSSVPHGERVPAWPTVPRLPANAFSYFSVGSGNGLIVAQASAVWFERNGNNIVYIDWENDIVAVVRWIDPGPSLNDVVGKMLASIKTPTQKDALAK